MKLQIRPRSWQQVVKQIEIDPPHFFLRQADLNVLNFYKMNLPYIKKVKNFSASNVIDYQSLSHIAYNIRHGKEELFIYFKYLHYSLDILILVTLLLISITLLFIKNRKITKIKESLVYLIGDTLTLLTVLITSIDKHALFSGKRIGKVMLVLGPWFFSAYLIAIVFNNLLLESMVKAIPNQVIDSWEDLASNKHLKILVENVEFLSQYSLKSNSIMAKRFKGRVQSFGLQDLANMTMVIEMCKDMLNGRAVYVKNKLTMIYHILWYQSNCKLGNQLVDSMHLSKYGGPSDQYFLIIPSTTSNDLADAFNE